MLWQDIVITVGQWIFLVALIPSIRSTDKPAFWTSVMTGGILLVFGLTYATMGLWYSAFSSACLALGWCYLSYQKWRQKSKV
ncbi:hypothetical protein A2671_02625 [Candidatus Kaiserbacteria bacterium RIFCSPHIGHO2_01_FULL_49_13]|uniref:Uncharacterized protein n=1 Tax=Candidatus Kaiserbacteria bacterium RIFCSPHIGHO2_01_FULL_49_13 TaxID=1798477 RepID=A0A1F6CDK5_9BACT|nr:MAG: hypothetical protein A2671_02625 [Candidatus Kaiserbacteria bacterium RIFCSPHIGHO2_01_FULL_49_13]